VKYMLNEHIDHGLRSLNHPASPDGFALTDVDASDSFARIAAEALRVSLSGLSLTRGTQDAVQHIMDGFAGIPDQFRTTPDGGGRRHLEAGTRFCTPTRSSSAVSTRWTQKLVGVYPWDLDGAARAGLASVWINRTGGPYPEYFEARTCARGPCWNWPTSMPRRRQGLFSWVTPGAPAWGPCTSDRPRRSRPALGRAETPVSVYTSDSPWPILVPESMESLRCERGPCCARSRAPSWPDAHPGQKINPRSNPQRSET